MTTFGFGMNGLPIETLRGDLLHAVARTAADLLLDPNVDKAKEKVLALEDVFQAGHSLVCAASKSNKGYEVTDLPVTEGQAYDHAKHLLSLLRKLYVDPTLPQEAP